MERFPTRMQVALSGEDAEKLDRASLRGEVLHLERGADVTLQSLPPVFAHDVGRTFEAELRIDFTPEPWEAEFRAITATSEESVRVRMEPVVAPPEWDRVYEGRFGGLTITLSARLRNGDEAVAVKWTHRSDGSPAREQLVALRFLAAMHEEGEMVMRECEEGRRLLSGPNQTVAAEDRLPVPTSLIADVVVIEDWVGSDLKVPAEISGQEIAVVAEVAEAIRVKRAQFTGESFGLVGDPELIPQFEGGPEVEIGEDWVVEIFDETLALGRRRVKFRPLAVRRGELVEPGRQEVEIEPGPLVEGEQLWWALVRPD